jgi:hypothetical protein
MTRIAVLLIVLTFVSGASAQSSEKVIYQGQLTVGKTESIIIYLSAETDLRAKNKTFYNRQPGL